MPFINLAGYQFVSLEEIPKLQEELKALCLQGEIKGTILLAEEGINFFVAGTSEAADQLLARLR
ncbi:MAG: pseudouridine synthase, partial [Verrucomicrobiota bacterium]